MVGLRLAVPHAVELRCCLALRNNRLEQHRSPRRDVVGSAGRCCGERLALVVLTVPLLLLWLLTVAPTTT